MTTTRCARCGRAINGRADSDRWFALGFGTTITGHVCPKCQTGAERQAVAESLAMDRVLDRGGTVFVPGGRIVKARRGQG